MTIYRLSWRDPLICASLPDFAYWRLAKCARDVQRTARGLVRAEAALGDEFLIELLGQDGRVHHGIVASGFAVDEWNTISNPLPRATSGGDWRSHLNKTQVAAAAFTAVRREIRRAYTSRAIGRAEAMQIIAMSRQHLDNEPQ